MFEKSILRRDTEPAAYLSVGRTQGRPRSDTWPISSETSSTPASQGWLRLERTTSIWEVQRQIKGISTAQATFSIVASLLGACILALPYAFASTGWVFVPILIVITCSCCYTARLLIILVNEVQPTATGPVSTYEALAEEILGKWGLWVTSLVMFVELYGCGVGYLILIGANLHRVFPALSAAQFTMGAAAALFPSLLVGFEALSNFSSLGLISACLVTLAIFQAAWAVVAATAQMPEDDESQSTLGIAGSLQYLIDDHTEFYVPSGLGTSCGIALFSFASHCIIPEIYASTKDKWSFLVALDHAFMCVLVLFVAIGSAGYLAYGDAVAQQFTLDLSGGVADLACLAISLNVAFSFGLFMAPSCKLLETAIEGTIAKCRAFCTPVTPQGYSKASDSTMADDKSHEGKAQTEEGGTESQQPEEAQPWLFLRLLVVVSATVIAVRFPNFALVLSLIGCICDMTICFILPAVMHIIIVRHAWASAQCNGEKQEEKAAGGREVRASSRTSLDSEEHTSSFDRRGLSEMSTWQLIILVVGDVALVVLGVVGMVVGIGSNLS